MTSNAASLKPKAHSESMNVGLTAAYRREMAKDLSDILAESYRLLIKSHIYHWNVVGPLFKPLHELTEEHYKALFEAIDIVAERIRALGHLAPANLDMAARFAPKAGEAEHLTAASMIDDLIAGHEAAVRLARTTATKADDHSDVVTADMLTDRLTFHEKALWMLRAIASE
ncbi:Dps family protein [Allorhizobium borbori]|uniref:Starvation-inducible DNA-binding protein n=1 Tax=Allorhizobium borbori TaxID=485907 RepID=A0A7W6NZP4_9HYPH|nr:DNA starvation/stationary phase protection protein [Allorhizobium borbori]MBB4101947.1 starvation-inducible DNA-binding protein [Allorhizobium borbori]PZU23427.1 MAG: DNA starvation/stationary phase protection protein [Shinella sp.]